MATIYKDEIYIGVFTPSSGKKYHLIYTSKKTEYKDTWKVCCERPLILTDTLDEQRHYDYRLPTKEELDFIFQELPESQFSKGAYWSCSTYLYDQVWGRSTMGISYGPMTQKHICRKVRTVEVDEQ